MVLPDRIELSTSPLPMECSTTELRQHAPDYRNRPLGPQGGRSLPQGPRLRKRGGTLPGTKNRPIGAKSSRAAGQFGPRPGSRRYQCIFPASGSPAGLFFPSRGMNSNGFLDEGRQRSARAPNRRTCATGSPEAGAARKSQAAKDPGEGPWRFDATIGQIAVFQR